MNDLSQLGVAPAPEPAPPSSPIEALGQQPGAYELLLRYLGTLSAAVNAPGEKRQDKHPPAALGVRG